MAIYLLSYCEPFYSDVRDKNGAAYKIDEWVIKRYNELKKYLPEPYLFSKLQDIFDLPTQTRIIIFSIAAVDEPYKIIMDHINKKYDFKNINIHLIKKDIFISATVFLELF